VLNHCITLDHTLHRVFIHPTVQHIRLQTADNDVQQTPD